MPVTKKHNVKASLSSGEIEFCQLLSFFSISGLTSANKWSSCSGSILKYIRKTKEIQNDYFLNYILFHLESGDLKGLFKTTKMRISKIENIEPFKFSKHLFLKILFKFRSNLRELFFKKLIMELDKRFNVIVEEFILFIGYFEKRF